MRYFTASLVVMWVIYFGYLFFIDKKITRINRRLQK
jgi:CcmD family protein